MHPTTAALLTETTTPSVQPTATLADALVPCAAALRDAQRQALALQELLDAAQMGDDDARTQALLPEMEQKLGALVRLTSETVSRQRDLLQARREYDACAARLAAVLADAGGA